MFVVFVCFCMFYHYHTFIYYLNLFIYLQYLPIHNLLKKKLTNKIIINLQKQLIQSIYFNVLIIIITYMILY